MLTEQDLKDEFDRLRGRVLGSIEACGLPERQESALKNLYKALTYDAQGRLARKLDG